MRTDWSPGFWQRLYATFVRNRLQSQSFHRSRRRALRNSARTSSWEMLEPRAMLAGDGFITQSSLVNPSFEAVDASVYGDPDIRGAVGWAHHLNTGGPWNAGSTATTTDAGNFEVINDTSLTGSRYMRLASDGGSISGLNGSGAISQNLGRMEAGKTYTLTADVFGGIGNTGYEVLATLTSDLVGGTTFATATSGLLLSAYEFSDGGSVVSYTATAQDAGRDLWITYAATQPGDGLYRRGGIDDIQLQIADSEVVQGPSAPSKPLVSTLVNGSFEEILDGASDPLYGGEPFTNIRDAAGWFHGVNTGAPWNAGSTYTTGPWLNYDGIDESSLDGARYMRLASDGGSIYGLNGYGAITQYLGQMEAGKTYTLTADVFGGNGNIGYELVATLESSIVGGTTFATASIANLYQGQISRNGSVVSYTAMADDAGKDLWIKYATTQPGWGYARRGGIDNVRLEVADPHVVSAVANGSFEDVDGAVYLAYPWSITGATGWNHSLTTATPANAGSTPVPPSPAAGWGNFDAIDSAQVSGDRYMRLASDQGEVNEWFGYGAVAQYLGQMEAGKTYTLTADVFAGHGSAGYEVVATLESTLGGGTTYAQSTSPRLADGDSYYDDSMPGVRVTTPGEFREDGSVVFYTATADDAGKDLWIRYSVTQPGAGHYRRGGIDNVRLAVTDSTPPPPPTPSGSLSFDLATLGATPQTATLRLSDDGSRLIVVSGATEVATVAYSNASINVALTARAGDTLILDLRSAASPPKANIAISGPASGLSLVVLGRSIAPVNTATSPTAGTLAVNADTSIAYGGVSALTVVSVAAASDTVGSVVLRTGGGLLAGGDSFTALNGRLTAATAASSLVTVTGLSFYLPASGVAPAIGYDISQAAFLISGSAVVALGAGRVPVTLGSRGLVIENGALTAIDMTFNGTLASGGLVVGGATFTLAGLRVAQTVVNSTFTVTGATQATGISGILDTLTVRLGSAASATSPATTGLVVANGAIAAFDMAVTSAINLEGLSLAPTAVAATLDAATGKILLTGTATASGITGAGSLAVQLGSVAAAAAGGLPALPATTGLVIAAGRIESCDMAVTAGTFSIDGLSLSTRGLKIARTASGAYRMTGLAAFTPTSESEIQAALPETGGLSFVGIGGLTPSVSAITAFTMTVSQAFSVGGLAFAPLVAGSVAGLTIRQNLATKSFTITGSAGVTATRFAASEIILGGNQTAGLVIKDQTITSFVMQVASTFTAAAHAFTAGSGMTLSRSSGSGTSSQFVAAGTATLTSQARNWAVTLSGAAGSRLLVAGGTVTELGMTVAPGSVTTNSQQFNANVGSLAYTVVAATGVGRLTGSAQLTVLNLPLTVTIGATSSAGWTYTDGVADSTVMKTGADFAIGGISFGTSNLTIQGFTAPGFPATGLWRVTGAAKFGMGLFDAGVSITLGSDDDPSSGWLATRTSLSQLDFRIDAGFDFQLIKFTTTPGVGLRVRYTETLAVGSEPAHKTFTLTGGASAAIVVPGMSPMALSCTFGGTDPKTGKAVPGLVIQDGKLLYLDVLASFNANFGGTQILARDIHFVYDRAAKRFAFSGQAALIIKGTEPNLAVTEYYRQCLGLPNVAPGVAIYGGVLLEFGQKGLPGIEVIAGRLERLDVAVSGSLGVKKVSFSLENMRLTYVASTQTFNLSGAAGVEFANRFALKVTFGYQTSPGVYAPGLTIVNGTLELLDMTVDSSLKFGALELGTQGLRFRYVRDFRLSVPGEQSRFTMTGQIFATLFETQKVSLQFGSDDGQVAGIVVEEGKLTYVDAQIISGMEIGGFKLPLEARLGVVYFVEAKQVVIYGSAMVEMKPLFTMHTRMGGGSREEAIRTKDDPNAPGFVIVNGKLTKFEFEVTNIYGGPFQSGTMYAKWFPATAVAAARFELSGSATINAGIGPGTASIGTRSNPGLIIEGKTLKKLDFVGSFSDTLPIIDLSANFTGRYDAATGFFRLTGTAGLAIESISIPEKWWAITIKKETPRVNVGQVSLVLNVNINNPRTDASYFTAGVSLFGLPQVSATVKFGTPKIELDFSPWGDALKNAFKEVGKKIAAGFKKLFGKKGQIDGATIFYDPTGASIVNGVLTFEPTLYTHSTTKADGSTAVPIGERSGRLVLFGGTDTSTTLSNNLVMIAPGDADTVTPYTTLLVNLLDNQDDTVETGSARIREVFGLDEDFDLLSAPYLLDAIGGSEPAARAFRGDVKIVSLADMVTGSLAGLPNTVGAVPTKQSLGLFFCSSLAEAVHTAAQNDQQLDLADAATVRALIEATASRAGIALTDPAVAANVAAAADIAAGVMSRIDAATPAGSAAYMTAIVKVQKLATGAIPEQFALVNAGTTTSAAVAAAFSGTALDTLIASQIVGNLDAPQVSISDPTVTLAADGSATLDFAVTIAGTSSPDLPISVAYMTQDSTATVADDDYDAVSGTLTWAPGDTSTKYVSVPVRAGNTPTASQFFLLDATATNAVVADIGAGQIDLAPLTTTTGLVVSSESGIPRNITVLEATILSAVAGDVPATGSVTFYDGSTELGTVDLDLAGKATWQSDLLLAGSHTFRAVYSGGTSQGYTLATSTSADQTVTVGTTQTISVDPIADHVWGIDDTTVQVMAGASSGMPVSYSVTGPATIDAEGLVTITGLGHVVVTVSQAGDDYTTAATPVVVAFDVARPTIIVRIDSQTADYGDDLSAIGLTYSMSGFLGDDSSASLAGLPVVSVAPGAVHAGTYAITATTAADSKYDFQYEAGTLTIRKAILTVTVADKTVGYGASVPTLTYSIAGFVHGDTASVLDALPQLATTAAGSNAGGYDITAADVEDDDYEIVIVPGTLTITPAALTVTADDKAITYGDALPAFTARYSGFVNGDTAASLDTAASVAVGAASFHAGSYVLTAADAFDPNYTISFVPGALSVAKAPLSITAASLTQVAGRTQPTLTALYSGFVNGETAAVLTTQPQLSTASTGAVGSYAIDISGATADDYGITHHAGTLTVIADTPSFGVLSSIAAPLAGDTPTYTVTIVSGIDGQTITAGSVQFRFDGVDQGSPVSLDSNGTASFTAAPLAAGSHTITAVYSGATGIDGGTQSLAQTVGQYGATTAFVSASLAATYGGTPTYTVRVTPTDVSNGIPSGTVQFVVDGVDFGAPVALDGNGEATSVALAVLGAGTHTVLARFTSSNGFQSGADSVVLEVARKTITIVGLTGVNKTYDGTTAATVSGTAAYDGLVDGELFGVVGTGTATFADASAGVGKTVTIAGYSAPSGNYELAASPTVTATIAPKAITIVGLAGVNKTYDRTTAASFFGAAAYSGLVAGESFTVVGTGTATFADANVGTGKTVTIAGYAAPSANYVLPVNPSVTATISPVRLTVRANDASRPYGAANPGNLRAVITGFVAGETAAAVVSGTPAFTVAATATSPVSPSGYAITPTAGSLTAKNYVFDTFQAGSLVVTKAALTVTAVAATKVSGTADPTFTFSVGGLVAGNTVATSLSGSLTRDVGDSAGSYTIRQGSLGLTASAAANYDLTYQPATFTILAAPRLVVSDGFVKGSTWNTGYLAVPTFTTTAAGSQLGQPLADGPGQLAAAAALTWTNLNVVSLRFNEPVAAPAATSLVLRGVTGSGVGVQSVITSSAVVVLDGGTVVQWTLPQSLVSGRYEMTIADGVIRSSSGSRALDGEWTNGTSTFGSGSGNGTAGGAFVYRFSVLAGDINASGTVAADDQATVQAGQGQPFSAANYRFNVNGDTGINAVDTSLVSLQKGKTTLSGLGAFVAPLTAGANASVDAAFNVTFADDSAWRAAITGIKVGSTATNGVLLPASAYTISAGRITFTPAAAALLQTSGTKVIAVVATGYADNTVRQTITAGVARALAVTTQPVGPTANGGLLTAMPVVRIVDQYGNTVTGSTLAVVARVETGTGNWSLSGGTSVAATAGVATFSTLRATSVGGAARARIRFTCGSLTTVLSNEFAVPAV
jgi:hypothetical protein